MSKNLFICHTQAQLILASGLALGRFKDDENLLMLFVDFGIKDELKGELPIAFCILRDPSIIDDTEGRFRVEQQIMGVVARSLGALARPAAIYFPKALPKTRSGKILRRAIRALAEGQETGDMSTLEDPTSIDAVKVAIENY